MATSLPWHRRQNETLQAYEAFNTYLLLGPERSQERVAKTLGKSRQLMDRWSTRHAWVLRITAYEEHFALKALDATEDDRIELMREHMNFASSVLRRARARLEFVTDDMPEDEKELEKLDEQGKLMTVDQALRAGDLAVKIGRLATGLDGDYTPPESTGEDLGNLTVDELEMFESLLDKARGK